MRRSPQTRPRRSELWLVKLSQRSRALSMYATEGRRKKEPQPKGGALSLPTKSPRHQRGLACMAGGLNLQLVVRWRLGDLEVPALVNLQGGCPPLPPLPRALFQRICSRRGRRRHGCEGLSRRLYLDAVAVP